MAPHSSTLAWKIPSTEEPGRLQSIGSLRVGHDWATSRSLFTFTHWRRKWQSTPVFLPGESQGEGSLVGCHLWGRPTRTESDTTDVTQQQQQVDYKCLTLEWLSLLLVHNVINLCKNSLIFQEHVNSKGSVKGACTIKLCMMLSEKKNLKHTCDKISILQTYLFLCQCQ